MLPRLGAVRAPHPLDPRSGDGPSLVPRLLSLVPQRVVLTGILTLLGVGTSIGRPALAQDPAPGRMPIGVPGTSSAPASGSAASRLPSAMREITVTPAQRAAMRASWAQVSARWEAVLAEGKATGRLTEAAHTELRGLASEHNARLLTILTPAQRTTLEANLTAQAAARDAASRQAAPQPPSARPEDRP